LENEIRRGSIKEYFVFSRYCERKRLFYVIELQVGAFSVAIAALWPW
jgi:hypothetical protein